MDDPDEQQAWLALARVPGLTANALRPAIEAVGSAATLCCENAARLLALGLPPGTPAALRAAAAHRDADRDWLAATDHHLLTLADAAFPPLLLALPDAPVTLWVRGQPEVLRHPQVAVVGSRHPSPTGREIAHEFAAGLTRAGFAVTSGLALGIDAAAHRGALAAGGYTVAVCGTGLDRVYPTEHASLAAGIAAQGALVSDQPLGTPPLKHNFPHRNRLISGLALGTLVVEAAARSGSLITARLAGEQGRELFAVPGSIRNPLARGCHALLKQGARLVESVDDVLAELGGLPLLDVALQSARAAAPAQPPRAAAVDAGADGARLLDALGYEPVDADTLSLRTGLPAQTVSATLLLLELAGQVECTPDGCFSRVPGRRY